MIIKLFLTDIDGVWTDGSMYYDQLGNELKRFHTYDSAGVLFLRLVDIPTMIITGEDTEIVKRRADKLKITGLYQGVKNKAALAKELCAELEISLSEVAFIGDDINDFSLLQQVGLSACPANAPSYIKEIVDWSLPVLGGQGAFRCFVERYLKEIGKLDVCLSKYLADQNSVIQ